MKDNYSEINVDMEQILFSKEYEQLTTAELDEIKDFVSSKEEFMQMRSTLMNVKNSFGTEVELEPRNSSKDDLMKMFNDKHGKVIPMNTRRPFYMNPFVQVGVAATLILGIIFFYPKGTDENPTAMNDSVNKEESNSANAEGKKMADEESINDIKEAEEMTAEEIPSEEIPALLKDEYKADVPKITLTEKEAMAEGGKFETAKKSVEKTVAFDLAQDKTISNNANDSMSVNPGYLYSDVKRSSDDRNQKGKETKKADEDLAIDGTATGSSVSTTAITNTAVVMATGGTSVADDLEFASKLKEEKEKDKKTEDEYRTNTAGGYYHQPAAPASDIKTGVTMKDKPALSEFLFTAL